MTDTVISVRLGNFGDLAINNGYIAYFFQCACAKLPYFYSWSEIWRHHCHLRPQFPVGCGNSTDLWTFKAEIGIFMFGWISRTFWPKTEVFGGKIGEGVVPCWPPMNSFLLLGVVTSVPLLAKIDQEMQPWECRQTDRQTDGHMHRQRQTRFIICPMLYAIAMR